LNDSAKNKFKFSPTTETLLLNTPLPGAYPLYTLHLYLFNRASRGEGEGLQCTNDRAAPQQFPKVKVERDNVE